MSTVCWARVKVRRNDRRGMRGLHRSYGKGVGMPARLILLIRRNCIAAKQTCIRCPTKDLAFPRTFPRKRLHPHPVANAPALSRQGRGQGRKFRNLAFLPSPLAGEGGGEAEPGEGEPQTRWFRKSRKRHPLGSQQKLASSQCMQFRRTSTPTARNLRMERRGVTKAPHRSVTARAAPSARGWTACRLRPGRRQEASSSDGEAQPAR